MYDICDTVQEKEGQAVVQGSMRLTFFHSEYGGATASELQEEYGAAHLVFGPNAGMPQNSWPFQNRSRESFAFHTDTSSLRVTGSFRCWAGLAASPSWQAAVLELVNKGRPMSFFTDYCEEAMTRAAEMVRHFQVQALRADKVSVPVCVNPFRHPVRINQADNALPSYGNCFLFAFN